MPARWELTSELQLQCGHVLPEAYQTCSSQLCRLPARDLDQAGRFRWPPDRGGLSPNLQVANLCLVEEDVPQSMCPMTKSVRQSHASAAVLPKIANASEFSMKPNPCFALNDLRKARMSSCSSLALSVNRFQALFCHGSACCSLMMQLRFYDEHIAASTNSAVQWMPMRSRPAAAEATGTRCNCAPGNVCMGCLRQTASLRKPSVFVALLLYLVSA